MPSNAHLLEKLIKAGTPAALVAEVALALANAENAVLQVEERKRRDRERKSPHKTSVDNVPRNSAEIHEIRGIPVVPRNSEYSAELHGAASHVRDEEINPLDSKNQDIKNSPSESKKTEDGPDLASANGHSVKIKRRKPAEDLSWIADVGGEWNELASQLRFPQVNELHPRRQAMLRQRRKDLAELGHDDPLEAFSWFFNKIRGSPFLRGEKTGSSPVTFEWAMNLSNFHKIIDGNYETDRQGSAIGAYRQ